MATGDILEGTSLLHMFFKDLFSHLSSNPFGALFFFFLYLDFSLGIFLNTGPYFLKVISLHTVVWLSFWFC